MPVIEVAVDGYAGLRSQMVMAIVDSGADGTMLPIDVLEAVGALYQDTVQMRGILGESERADRYTVGLKLGPLTLHSVDAVAIPAGAESVIGRNVLNQLLLTLNGSAFTTQIEIDS